MYFYMLFVSLIYLVSLVHFPFYISLDVITGLIIVEGLEQTLHRHVTSKPAILRCLRNRKYICMTVGALLQFLSIFIFSSAMVGLAENRYGIIPPPNGTASQIVEMGFTVGEKLLDPNYIQAWGQETIMFLYLKFPYIVSDILTSWILIMDLSRIKLLHRHLDVVGAGALVKDIVAYGITGASGILCSYIFLSWASVFTVTVNTFGRQIDVFLILERTLDQVMEMQRYVFKVLLCQMLFCLAVAERDVLQKKHRLWLATIQTAAIAIVYHLLIIFPTPWYYLSLLQGLPKTVISVVAVYCCWRKYQSLLAEAYSKSDQTTYPIYLEQSVSYELDQDS